MKSREEAIVFALFAMDGDFTINRLADKAGGNYLYKQASAIIKRRVAQGSVLVVDDECLPVLYRLAPDV